MHGVSLSIGTVDPLNSEYLQKLKALADHVQPAWISDHLCWTGVAHRNTHDLLPVPYTEEALRHVVKRIKQVQEVLGQRIAIENPSTYLEFQSSTMPEAEFLAAMAAEADCLLLLDVNNVYCHLLQIIASMSKLTWIACRSSGSSRSISPATVITAPISLTRMTIRWWRRYGRSTSTLSPARAVSTGDTFPTPWWSGTAISPNFLCWMPNWKKPEPWLGRPGQPVVLPDLVGAHPPYRINAPILLSDEQIRMQEAILQGVKADAKPETWIRSKEAFPPAEQLGVYIHAYRSRLYDVTAEDYPVLKYAMEEESFERMLKAFVNTVPADHFNIGRYALKLPEFLAESRGGNGVFCRTLYSGNRHFPAC